MEFTKEELEEIVNRQKRGYFAIPLPFYQRLAAFALTLMAERDEARRELAEAEEAILAVRERVLQTKAGEPREAIWDLLKFFAIWDAGAPAVRRALERGEL